MVTLQKYTLSCLRKKTKVICLLRIALLSIIIACSGCGHRVVKPPKVVLQSQEVQQLLQKIESARSDIKTYRALYRVVAYQDDIRSLMRYALVADGFDKMRLDVLPISGVYTIGLFATVDGHAVAIDPLNKRALSSDNSSRAIYNLIGLSLNTDELLSAVLGIVPQSIALENLKIGKTSSNYEVSSDDGLLRWIFDTKTLKVSQLELRRREKQDPVAVISYQQYRTEGVASIPSVLVLQKNNANERLELALTSCTLNSAVAPDKFALTIPEDYSDWSSVKEIE